MRGDRIGQRNALGEHFKRRNARFQTSDIISQCDVVGFAFEIGVIFEFHGVDFVLCEIRRSRNRYVVFFLRFEVARRHVDDAVGVDVERDFDIDLPSGRASNAAKRELGEHLVIVCLRMFALQDDDAKRCLVVFRCRKDGTIGAWNRRIFGRNDVELPTVNGDAQIERRHVEQDVFLPTVNELIGLNRRAHRHDFVGIDVFGRRFLEKLRHSRLNEWHPRHAAD